MNWSIGELNGRDIGYGVPAICDQPQCIVEIDRGLSYVCGGEPYGGDYGCGLFFCQDHREYEEISDVSAVSLCRQCRLRLLPFEPSPDTAEWNSWKLTDGSWQPWRDENPEKVAELKSMIGDIK